MMLTYKLIKNHCGKISLSSIENMGTTFKLSFPIKSRKYNNKLFPKADVIDPLPIVREENKEEVPAIAEQPEEVKQADNDSSSEEMIDGLRVSFKKAMDSYEE